MRLNPPAASLRKRVDWKVYFIAAGFKVKTFGVCTRANVHASRLSPPIERDLDPFDH